MYWLRVFQVPWWQLHVIDFTEKQNNSAYIVCLTPTCWRKDLFSRGIWAEQKHQFTPEEVLSGQQ